jgi:hypothetical protein
MYMSMYMTMYHGPFLGSRPSVALEAGRYVAIKYKNS